VLLGGGALLGEIVVEGLAYGVDGTLGGDEGFANGAHEDKRHGVSSIFLIPLHTCQQGVGGEACGGRP